MTTRLNIFVFALALVALVACTPASTDSRSQPQGSAAIAEMQRRMTPTQHLFADADRKLLWEAVKGYMDAAFPVETSEPGFVETETMEWVEWRMPHRTRVTVELETVDGNPDNVVMLVCALKIEPAVRTDELVTGKPVRWNWRLEGHRRNVEEVVVGQILRRYLLLREGRDPTKVPIQGPIPGLSPKPEGYFKPGTAQRSSKGS